MGETGVYKMLLSTSIAEHFPEHQSKLTLTGKKSKFVVYLYLLYLYQN